MYSLTLEDVDIISFASNHEEWNFLKFPPGHFQIIIASIPHIFSKKHVPHVQFSNNSSRNSQPSHTFIQRILTIINYYSPHLWWLEGTRVNNYQDHPVLKGTTYIDIDYCQFSTWGYQGPTRFWVSENLKELPSVLCDHQTCENLEPGTQRHRAKKPPNVRGPPLRIKN